MWRPFQKGWTKSRDHPLVLCLILCLNKEDKVCYYDMHELRFARD